MKRPIRIPIFGIICLLFGGIILLHNLSQLGVAIGGPDAIQVPAKKDAAGQFADSLRISSLAMQDAMREPAYRIGIGVKSVLSLLMVGMLIGAGIGLLRNQPWTLQLAKLWAIYAVISSTAITVLQMVYLVPKMDVPEAPPGTVIGMYVGMVFMQIMLWIFPVLLFFLLPTRKIVAYLNNPTPGQSQLMPAGQPVAEPPPTTQTPASPTPTPTPTENAPPMAEPSATDMTWRDDPWNDPSSK